MDKSSTYLGYSLEASPIHIPALIKLQELGWMGSCTTRFGSQRSLLCPDTSHWLPEALGQLELDGGKAADLKNRLHSGSDGQISDKHHTRAVSTA